MEVSLTNVDHVDTVIYITNISRSNSLSSTIVLENSVGIYRKMKNTVGGNREKRQNRNARQEKKKLIVM